jgi:hypothetical protein
MPKHDTIICDSCAQIIQRPDFDIIQVLFPRELYPFNNKQQEYKPAFWAYFCNKSCLINWVKELK